MKKCPYCGSQIADDCKFCSECGKEYPNGNTCRYCGALIYEGDVYCENCGKKIEKEPISAVSEQSFKSCPHCGAKLESDSIFCGECGKRLDEAVQVTKPIKQETTPIEEVENNVIPEEYEEQPSSIKQYLPYIIGGLIICALVGGSWFGYKEYIAYSAEKEAREKFVADSLEKVRQDSLNLVAQKEKDELDAAKLGEFREKFKFKNILALLENYDKAAIAQKCGLELIYKEIDKDGEIECEEYVYGYDVEKGDKKASGYEIVAKSNHACYLIYNLDSSTYASINFKDSSDAENFQEQAKEYGLLVKDDYRYVPKTKMGSGYHYVDSLDWGGDYDPIYGIRETERQDGWYCVRIGIDF